MEQATGARRAAVAMSGGVDSSVAALLLAQAGWACTGVTLRLYAGADAAPDGARTCCSLEDVEDARAVGMVALAALVGNGTNIGGTQFETLSEAARAALLGADVIVSKGLGNFETLTGIGLNIYYLFLAKCPFYEKWFGMRHMSGQLVNERRFARP